MKLLRTEVLFRVRRTGMTLMELVVVMTILVGLAGIVAALLPNFLTKTHDSVTVSNIAEVDKAMMGYLSTNLSYPNYFDSIISSSGTSMYSKAVFNSSGDFATQFGNQATFNGQNVFSVSQLSSGEASSLALAGISNLMLMQDPPDASQGATYGAYLGNPITAPSGATSVASGTNVVIVNDPTYVYNAMHIPPKTNLTYGTDPSAGYRYVVFGLGQYCTLVGSTAYGIFEAPVSFGEHMYEQPQNAYARMICFFRVYSSGQRCEFLGAAHPDPTGFGTAAMHTAEFYQTN